MVLEARALLQLKQEDVQQLQGQTTRPVQQISLVLFDFCRASAARTELAAIVLLVVVLVGLREVESLELHLVPDVANPLTATSAARTASTVEEFVVEVAAEEKPDEEEGELEERLERDCCSTVEP